MKNKLISSILIFTCLFSIFVVPKTNAEEEIDYEAVLQKFIDENITENMSDLEKFRAITKYTATEYGYDYRFQSYQSMIEYGGGDCWASSNMINKLCSMVGIKSHTRNANKDPGAGSGHRNVIALIDGKYYIGEAGFSGEKPRYWSVYQTNEYNLNYDYTNKTASVIQYDGFDENLVIPEKAPNGYTITGINNSAFYRSAVEPKTVVLPNTITKLEYASFFYCEKLESITIPASVTEIGGALFTGCSNLKEVKIEGNNFIIDNNILYTADKTKLVEILPMYKQEELIVPSSVKEIGLAACRDNKTIKNLVLQNGLEVIDNVAFSATNITSVSIPGTCKKVCNGAFYDCWQLKNVIIEDGVEELEDGAFYWSHNLRDIQIPKSVTIMGKDLFEPDESFTMYVEKDSVAEQYAKDNNRNYVYGKLNEIKDSMVIVQESIPYNGKQQYPDVKVKLGSKILSKDVDYRLEYDKDLINSGKKTIKVIGIGNYSGEVTGNYTIQRVDPEIEFTCADVYEGEELKPVITKNPYNIKVEFGYGPEGANWWSYGGTPTEVGNYEIHMIYDYTNFLYSSKTVKVKILEKEFLRFPDVKKSDWYNNAVEYVCNNKLMNGYTAGVDSGKFGPEDQITRGQIVTILYRREGNPAVSGDWTFKDTGMYDYYRDAIKWASQNGIVTGYTAGENAGKFMPDDPITREQLALILQRYAKYKNISVAETADLTGFKDYETVSPWALEGLKWVVSKGIISGDMATTPPSINPQGNATRAQAATMIMRFCENVK